MTLQEQIDLEIRKVEDKIKDLQLRYQGDLTILDARQASLKAAKKAIKKDLEEALAALEAAGILHR